MLHFSAQSAKIKRLLKILFVPVFLFMLIVFSIYLYSVFFDSSTRYDHLIVSISKGYELDPMLVKAVIWRESDFDLNVVGSKGEIGLMQLMAKSSVKDWENYTKRKIGNRGVLFNPKLNIEIGTWYLARCKKHWVGYRESNALALAEYNAGYSNVKKWIPKNHQGDVIDLIKFPSTKKYVISILEKYRSYQK